MIANTVSTEYGPMSETIRVLITEIIEPTQTIMTIG